MTLTHRRLIDLLRDLFAPDADEKRRRERALVDATAEIVGVTVPFLLGAAVLWAMATMAAGFNSGFF